MAITWQLLDINSIDPSTMRITIADFVDGVKRQVYSKDFSKSLNEDTVLSQMAQLVRQLRQKELDDALPFITLDLSNFENQVKP